MVFKSICDSVSTRAVTWVFSGYIHRAAHDHPVYIPCGLCGGVRVIFWPELDAPAGGVEDQLSVDADPRFADPVHRPLADEPQRPGRGQRPHPPPKELRVRGAATTARLQDRSCGFRVTAWPSADRPAAIGELHADREVLQLSAPAPQHLWRKVFIEAGGSRADAADYEEFESPGVGIWSRGSAITSTSLPTPGMERIVGCRVAGQPRTFRSVGVGSRPGPSVTVRGLGRYSTVVYVRRAPSSGLATVLATVAAERRGGPYWIWTSDLFRVRSPWRAGSRV